MKFFLTGMLGLGALVILSEAIFFSQYFFNVKEYDIGDGNVKSKKVRMVHLTDLHLRKRIGAKHRKLAYTINSLNADFLLITGDSIDRTGKLFALDDFFNLLSRDILKVAIPGNHEYKSGEDMNRFSEICKRHNCTLLVNQSKPYEVNGARIFFTGLDDMIEGDANFYKAVENLGREDNHLVLVHSPLHYQKIKPEIERINSFKAEDKKLNISYFLAGHTHGGQITMGVLAPVLPEKSGNYVHGWYGKEKPFLFLSKGFGTSTIPFRFGSRSEIIVFNYYCK